MPQSWTDGFDALLAQLSPGGRATGAVKFPYNMTMPSVKIAEAESVHAWFRRCVDGPLSGDVVRCAVEPNLAVFATVRWSAQQLDYANVQVLKTQVSLEDYYRNDSPDEAFMLRLDWDYGTLGPMFTHALPHMHYSSMDAAPRFGVDGLWSDNIVVDFLEFVYRHLFHEVWVGWAKRVWDRERGRILEDADPFDKIVTAFRESKIAVLREHSNDVQALKHSLRLEKDSWFPFRANKGDLQLLRYP